MTKGADTANPKRPYDTYFRTCTARTQFRARSPPSTCTTPSASRRSRPSTTARTYGVGLAATFSQEFTKLGGKIAVAQTATDTTSDYSSIISAIKSSGAKLVYYGGEYPAGAPLSKQLKAAGDDIPVMGGDGLKDPSYVSLGGAATNGDYATAPGAPIESLSSAKAFVANYKAAGYTSPYSEYGGYSYDSAWAIILAVKAVVAANGGKVPTNSSDFRAKVVAAEQNVSFSGVTGQVSFDQYGDTLNKELTMYQVVNGNWGNGVKVGTFTG